MTDPLVVSLIVEPAATRVALWHGGAQRFTVQVTHGALALAALDPPPDAVRRAIRYDAVRGQLADHGEDALRPDAFVCLGTGTDSLGIHMSRDPADDGADDAASLAYALGAAADVPAYVVESMSGAEAALGLDVESALLARAAARAHARATESPGSQDCERVVVALEPHGRVHALIGDHIIASVPAPVMLPESQGVEKLLRRAVHGDVAAADRIDAIVNALGAATLQAVSALRDVQVVMLTGSLAVHAMLTDEIGRAVRAVAPTFLLPGPRVERALADAAFDVLLGRSSVYPCG